MPTLKATLEDLQARLELVSSEVYPDASALVDPDTGELRKDLPASFISFDLITDTADTCPGGVKDSDARVQVTCGTLKRCDTLDLAEAVQAALVPAFYYPFPLNWTGKLRNHFLAQQDFRRTH